VEVLSNDSDALYLLDPGATTWTLVRQVPSAAMPALPSHLMAPSGLLIAGQDQHRLSVAPSVTAAGGSPARIVASVPTGSMCLTRWNGTSTRLLYAAFANDYKHATLYTVGADGSGGHALTGATDPGVCGATWSASGTTIAYVRSYAQHLPIGEYHEAMVMSGGHTRTVHLALSNKVHLDSVLAIAPDGRHALVGTKTVQPDGTCGDGGPDGFAMVDFTTGAAHPITTRGPGNAASLIFTFDPSGHLIADVESGQADGTSSESLEVFDLHGGYLRTLPKFMLTDDRSSLLMVTVVG
jgi:hypothetical protein